MKVDILAFGAHPDDVELACSGTIALQVEKGYKVGIVDLSRGELGTRGSGELRLKEAKNAAEILGVAFRDNLSLGDGFFEETQENLLHIIKKIRKYKPEVVLCNAPNDRHPDHGRASKLVSRACFLSGLRKINTEESGEAQKEWRPKAVYHYIQDRYIEPGFVVNITDHFDKKMAAIRAFSSQFYDPDSEEPETVISSKEFLEFIEARALQYGRIINATYGEGFVTERSVGTENILSFL